SDLADGLGEDGGAEVGQVVAIDRRDHDVSQLHLLDGRRDARRFLDVVHGRTSVRHRAVRTISRADVAENHERGRTMLPAFADVRAMRFLADGMQAKFAHERAQALVILSARRAPHDLVQGIRHSIWYAVLSAPAAAQAAFGASDTTIGARQTYPFGQVRGSA